MLHRLIRLLPLVVLALVLGTAPPVEAGPDIVTGTLRIPVARPIRTLDPALAHHDSERLCTLNLFDQLYEYEHLARPYALRPAMAAATPEVSKDRRTYTIKLKADLRFQDDPCFKDGKGRVVTAHDVVFCFKRLMDANVPATGRWLFERRIEGIDAFTKASAEVPKKPNRSSYTKEQGYPDVAGFEVVDDLTLKIRLVKPYPALTWVLAHSYASIYPPEAIAAYGKDFGRKPVGSGAYRLTTFRGRDEADLIAMVRRPNYREDLYPTEGSGADRGAGLLKDAGKQLPRNARVEVLVIPDIVIQWNRFLAGQIDACPAPSSNVHAILYANMQPLPWLAEKGITLHKDAQLKVMYTAFNMAHKVYGHQKAEKANDKARAIRRAISLLFEDGWSHHEHWSGLVQPVQGPLLEGFSEHDPNFQNPWKRHPGDTVEELVERAREVLSEAGIKDGEGVPELEIDIVGTGTDGSQRNFAKLKERLAQVGLKIKANYMSYVDMRARIDNRKSPIWSISWHLDYPDPENLLQMFYSPYAPLPNDSGYSNPEFDALYEEALGMPEGLDRTILYEQMQEIVAEDCVYIWSYRMVNLWTTHEWVSGWRRNDMCPKFFKYCSIDTGKQNKYRGARQPEK